MKGKGFEYLKSPWNYIDIIPLVLIATSTSLVWSEQEAFVVRPVNSMAALFMWFKFLYFMRIFKETGYLISMITEVIGDMRIFLSVFFITLAAFGHCFLILSLNKENDND